MTNINFADESFDAVIAIHVLEHIQDDLQGLKEIYRVLKPGGWALIAVPVYGEMTFEDRSLGDEERQKMYGLKDHVRMNGLDFKNKLANAGFTAHVRSIDDVDGNYVDRTASSPHIDSDRYLFYGEKPHRIPPTSPVK